MSVKFTSMGWTSLFGPPDPTKLQEQFFESLGLTPRYQSMVFTNAMVLSGSKHFTLDRITDKRPFPALVEYFLLHPGLWVCLLSLEVDAKDYSNILEGRYCLEDVVTTYEGSLLEITLELTYAVFGKSFVEVQMDADLHSAGFDLFCTKYGIRPLHHISHLSVSFFASTSSEECWHEILSHEQTLMTSNEGSVLSDMVVVPNFGNTRLIPELAVEFLFSTATVIYGPAKLLPKVEQLVVGLVHKSIGLTYLSTIMYIIQSEVRQLFGYVGGGRNRPNEGISWIYVDQKVREVEDMFYQVVNHYEGHLVDGEDPNFHIRSDTDFLPLLEHFTSCAHHKHLYIQVKSRVESQISSLRGLVTDKGEREEQKATERIVTVIGFLAVFEVISAILPLFPDTVATLIRLFFLVLLLPGLLLVWLGTKYRTSQRRAHAEELHELSSLRREKAVLDDNIQRLSLLVDEGIIQFSGDYLQAEVRKLVQRSEVVSRRIQELS